MKSQQLRDRFQVRFESAERVAGTLLAWQASGNFLMNLPEQG